MALGAILGASIGMLTGVTVGSIVFSSKDTRSFASLDQSADNVNARSLNPKPHEVKEILELSPHWTKWPDYERVAWINRMIATLWPHYNKAVADIVHESVTPVLDQTCQKVKILSSIDIEKVDLGSNPMRFGGLKTYETREDEVIIEAPVLWGSNAHIRISISIQLGPLRICIPVALKDIQLHAVARITIRPLVETLPCLGALHISLLTPPHLDMSLNLINNIDLMALPGIKEVASGIIQKVVNSMMLYPNQFSVDLMENGGVSPAPIGMLQVNLKKIENLEKTEIVSKSDAYCLLEVRQGRPQRSNTVKNSQNPVFNEKFHLIVDDPEEQTLKITVKDDDYGWSDHIYGTIEFALSELEAFDRPREAISISGDVFKEEDKGLFSVGSKQVKRLRSLMTQSKKSMPAKKSLGTVFLEVTFYPFFRPEADQDQDQSDEEEAQPSGVAESSNARSMASPSLDMYRGITNVREDMKGLLTITLTRALHLAGRDTYVAFHLNDKIKKQTEVQKSNYVLNDDSPRWGDKFDFVMINANSILTVMVMEKPGFMESMMTMKFVKKTEDKPIGLIRIPVPDIVRNGRLKDTYPLQEVQQGEIELALTWTTCEFAG